MLAVVFTLVWAAFGPVFNFSDTWQLIANTGTTIATFLAVFLIQNTQNRDSAALHLKLDELIRVSQARNDIVNIEVRPESEVVAARADMVEAIRQQSDSPDCQA
jgi:low affinity Fe/Cu permease